MNLAELRAHIAAQPKRPPIPEPLACEPAAGQVWTVRDLPEEQPTWLAVICGIEDELLQIFPAFRWGELRGPNDIVLPTQLVGERLIVSLDLQATVDRSALELCTGSVPPEAVTRILQADQDRFDDQARHRWDFGRPYLDEHDARLAYHIAINDHLEDLQEPVRRQLFASPEPLQFPSNLSLLFADFSMRAAADADASPNAGSSPAVIIQGETERQIWLQVSDFELPTTSGLLPLWWEWRLEEAIAGRCQVFYGDHLLGEAKVAIHTAHTDICLAEVDIPADAVIASPDDVRLVLIAEA